MRLPVDPSSARDEWLDAEHVRRTATEVHADGPALRASRLRQANAEAARVRVNVYPRQYGKSAALAAERDRRG